MSPRRNTKAQGTARENDALPVLRRQGWTYACRASNSLGVADDVALRAGGTTCACGRVVPHTEAMLLQVKTDARGPWGNFLPADRAELSAMARAVLATPMYWWWPYDRKGIREFEEDEWPPLREAA